MTRPEWIVVAGWALLLTAWTIWGCGPPPYEAPEEPQTVEEHCITLIDEGCSKFAECTVIPYDGCMDYLYQRWCEPAEEVGENYEQCLETVQALKCGDDYPVEACNGALYGNYEGEQDGKDGL